MDTETQIRQAQRGAVFVCNDRRQAMRMAVQLSRTDLVIVKPSWLKSGCAWGMNVTSVVVDHSVELTEAQSKFVEWMLAGQ